MARKRAKRGKRPTRKTKTAERKNPIIPAMVDFGKRLNYARQVCGITQVQLAERIGTVAQDIGQLENGWRAVSLPRVYVLAEALGVSAAWLLTGIHLENYTKLIDCARRFTQEIEQLNSVSPAKPAAPAPPANVLAS